MIFYNYISLLLLCFVSLGQREKNVESCQTSAADLVDTDPYQLTSHILDISRGIGAKNVRIKNTCPLTF
jgi:hypothetical protein